MIAPALVSDPGVPELFAAADAYGLSIYPPEGYHALDAAEFTRDDVTLLVARSDSGEALGMAALVDLGDGTGELKRMYVHDAARGLGIGAALLDAVETLAGGRGIRTLLLETGEPQRAAIAMYERAGYARVERFGPYVDDPTSVCMAKAL
ncbi:MAG: GNAT family N-acetyltransferase [Microbacteriaceae bacterium]|nr:GNAT family N-acetyltransferase [Microbacteriaceae bacterium]